MSKPWPLMTGDERMRSWLADRRAFQNGATRYDPGTFEEYSSQRSAEAQEQRRVDDVHARLRAYVGKDVEITLVDGARLSGRLTSEGARVLQLRSPGQTRPHDLSALKVDDVRLI